MNSKQIFNNRKLRPDIKFTEEKETNNKFYCFDIATTEDKQR